MDDPGATTGGLGERAKDLKRINRRSSREDILNVFTPNSPVTHRAKFAGRYKPLEEMINALLSAGADMIVFGERGSGKSSLARMLHAVASGDLRILDYYGLRSYLVKKGIVFGIGSSTTSFNVIWVDGFTRPLDEVIRLVLTRRRDREFGPGLLAYLPNEPDQVEVASKIGFDKVLTASGETKEVYVPPKPLNVKEGFEIAVQRYSDAHDEELLVLIDEFETIPDRANISQYLKTVGRVRFALMGIATTTLELIGQHASVARDTHAINLAPMAQDELLGILAIGDYVLSPYLVFTPSAQHEIVANSHGSPFWCHSLAKALVNQRLEAAEDLRRFLDLRSVPRGDPLRVVDGAGVHALLDALPTFAENRIWEEALNQITMQDPLTAHILGRIAHRPEGVISSAVCCSDLEQEGVSPDDTRQTIEGILGMEGSPLEERGRIRDVVSFSFRDPNFKRYILLRRVGVDPETPSGAYTPNQGP